jgi:hypothetical protein
MKSMGLFLRRFLLFHFFISGACLANAQGLPPGWEYSATPSTHIISLPVSSEPNINGFPLLPGDYIGVFYVDGNGNFKCGGAAEWLGDDNTGIIAFGNDPFTTEKDGFASNETINYRYYSWSVQKEYDATVVCNPDLPVTCSQFVSNGLSGVLSSTAEGFYVTAEVNDSLLCAGNQTQLFATPSGGIGTYSFQWTSTPSGFTSSEQEPFVSPEVSTLYTVTVSDNEETLSARVFIEVTQPPVAGSGSDQTICETSFAQLNGSQSNGSGFSWTTSGDGTFESPQTLNPLYYPGIDDIETGNAVITFTVLPESPCENPDEAVMNLQVISLPELEAGIDQQVCENNDVDLSAIVVNASQIEWSTNGDGFFQNPFQAETTYTPGPEDLQSGEVILTIVADAITPCSGEFEDTVFVEFAYLSEVSAGNDLLICEDGQAEVEGSVSGADSFAWASSGDGTFADPGSLSTVYTPGTNDIADGIVYLQLIAEPVLPCTQLTIDELELIITQYPQVNAGEDVTICEGNSFQISGSASGFDEIVWSSAGDGTFSDPFSLNTVYFPGTNDILNQGVELTLVAQPQFPCLQDIQDGFILSIQPLPDVDAGSDDTFCINTPVELSGEYDNSQTIAWSTLGDGTFDNSTIINPTYFPGNDDLQAGFVTLELMGEPLQPCLQAISDQVEIVFQSLPFANAGEDVTILSTEILQLAGEALDYSLLIWATEGDGTFNFFDILDPVYTPGDQDILNEGTILSLTAFPNSPCLVNDIDELTVTIDTVTFINELRVNDLFVVFPNPAKDFLIISSDHFTQGEEVKVEIFNETGVKFLSNQFVPRSGKIQLNTSNLASGIYHVQIIYRNFRHSHKLILTI